MAEAKDTNKDDKTKAKKRKFSYKATMPKLVEVFVELDRQYDTVTMRMVAVRYHEKFSKEQNPAWKDKLPVDMLGKFKKHKTFHILQQQVKRILKMNLNIDNSWDITPDEITRLKGLLENTSATSVDD